MVAAEIIIVIFLGLVFGSFATALIYRVPRNLPWARGVASARWSCCPGCEKVLRPLDLVPLLSWALNRGACRHCKAGISPVYPLTELGVLLACLGVYAVFGLTPEGCLILAAVPFLFALLVIDFEFLILPNQLVVITGALGLLRLAALVHAGADPAFLAVEYLLAAPVYLGFVWGLRWVVTRMLKKDALGLGDVKFFCVAGLWLGLSGLSWFCIGAGFLGILLGSFWQTLKKERLFPFGPALIVALYGVLLLRSSLLL